MSSDSKRIINEHAQKYVRAVMADQLRQEGFASKNGNDLQWYRVVDGNVLHAVFFSTQWAKLPLFMNIAYSCHPLFITPEYPSGVHMPTMLRSLEAVNPGRPITKLSNNAVYSPAAAVTCPNDAYKGSDILADILSRLNDARTVEQCYEVHKQRFHRAAEHLNKPVEEMYWRFSVDFMDEVVFFDDQELYPYCEDRIKREIERYNKAQSTRKLWNIEKYEIESLSHLKKAVLDHEPAEHLLYLEQKQISNIQQLKRKVKGIHGL